MVNVVVCPLLGATLIKLMLCNRTELERFPLHIRCVYFPTFARFLSNAGRRRASFGRRTRQRAGTGHRQSCCTGIAPSPLELGAQVRHAEARVDVRLADRLALLLAALALLGALLVAAAAAPPPRRVRVGEVEGAATGSTARPTATHLHQTDTSARPPSVSYRPAAHHPRRSSSALRDTPPLRPLRYGDGHDYPRLSRFVSLVPAAFTGLSATPSCRHRPHDFTTQTTSRSVQPFLPDSGSWPQQTAAQSPGASQVTTLHVCLSLLSVLTGLMSQEARGPRNAQS